MIIEALVGTLIPVVSEGLKQAVVSWFGGVKPTTIDEQIKLDKNEIEKLEALAKMDQPGGVPSQWVIDLRASARYIMAGVVIVAGVATIFYPVPPEIQMVALEASNIVFGFLFGSRIVAGWKGK